MKNNIFKWTLAMSTLVLTFSCSKKSDAKESRDMTTGDSAKTTAIKPTGTAPEWGKTMKPEMLAVIEKLGSYGDKPIETLTPQEARKNHIRMGRSSYSRSVPTLPTRRNALPHALFLQGWDLLRSSPTEARELDVPALLHQRRGASLATGFTRTSIPSSTGHGSSLPESH